MYGENQKNFNFIASMVGAIENGYIQDGHIHTYTHKPLEKKAFFR